MLKPAAVGFPNYRYLPETVTCGYPTEFLFRIRIFAVSSTESHQD